MSGPHDAASATFWIAVTIAAWLIAVAIERRANGHAIANPILFALALIIATLAATHTPYSVYAQATSALTFLLGPATVALAAPIQDNMRIIRRAALPVSLALVAGCATALGSAWAMATLTGINPALLPAMMVKSVTAPVAIILGKDMGGPAAITITMVLLTGITGYVLLSFQRPGSDPRSKGFTAGLAAHAFGVAKAAREGEEAGAFAMAALALNVVATSLAMALIHLLA